MRRILRRISLASIAVFVLISAWQHHIRLDAATLGGGGLAGEARALLRVAPARWGVVRRGGWVTQLRLAPLPWEGASSNCTSQLPFFSDGLGPDLTTRGRDGGRLRCAAQSSPTLTHVMYSADPHEWHAAAASAASVLAHASEPEAVRVHLVVPADSDELRACEALARPVLGDPALREAVVCEAPEGWLEIEENRARGAPTRVCGRMTKPAGGGGGSAARRGLAGAVPAGGTGDACLCPQTPQLSVHPFNASEHGSLASLLATASGGHKNDRKSLQSPLNFARNYAAQLFDPEWVRRLVYLDADTVLQRDARELALAELGREGVVGWVRSCRIRMKRLFHVGHPLVGPWVRPDDCYVNAGAFVVDLARYRDFGAAQRIEKLLRVHAARAGGGARDGARGEGAGGEGEEAGGEGGGVGARVGSPGAAGEGGESADPSQTGPLWREGTQQPSFVLALAPVSVDLSPTWHLDSLGYNPKKARLSSCDLQSAGVLHWNGAYKPWRCVVGGSGADAAAEPVPGDDPCYRSYWKPYATRDTEEEGGVP